MRPTTRDFVRAIGRLVLVGLLVGVLTGCRQGQGEEELGVEAGQALEEASPGNLERVDPDTPGVAESITTDNYAAIPESVGQVLTLEGPISSIIGERAFTLGAEDIGGQGLLVFSPARLGGLILEEGAVVQVTGMVRDTFSVEEAAEAGVEITDPEPYSDLEGVEWIDATVVSAVPEDAAQQ